MGLGLIEAVVGAALWAVANAVYFDMKRKGRRGFRRLLAFYFGMPATWGIFFFMPEGQAPRIEPPRDDEAGLLAEIRKDRAQRIVAASERDADPPDARTEEEQ